MSELGPQPEINKQEKQFTIQEGLDGKITLPVTESLSPDGKKFISTIHKNNKKYTGSGPLNEPRGTAVLDALLELHKDPEEKDIWTVKWE